MKSKSTKKETCGKTALVLFAFFLFQPALFSAPQYGKTILGIYRSSDGYKTADNPIAWYFKNTIDKTGLKITYHDFDSGIPDRDSLGDVRAIITWHNSGVVQSKEKAKEYIKFLDDAVTSGIKLVIINSFGAYGYREDGKEKWDLNAYYAPLFRKMGFRFAGYWTNDPGKLKIIKLDKSVAQFKGKQDVRRARHYQQIIPVRKDVRSYLVVKRTDGAKGLGDGLSSLILTSKNGGFALEQYVISKNTFMLNPEKFLRNSLFYDDGYQDVGVIMGKTKKRAFIENNLKYAFRYAKIKYRNVDVDALKGMVGEDLKPFEAIVIVADNLDNIPLRIIKDYTENGGNVIFLKFADMSNDYKKFLGIKSYGGSIDYFTGGFSLDKDFFFNAYPVTCKAMDLNVRRADLRDAKVIGTLLDRRKKNSYPVLWERRAGKGKVLYWNTDMLTSSKSFRGTEVQSIHYISSNFVTGLANIAMMMVDDFPAPWWNIYYKQYRIDYYTKKMNSANTAEEREKYSAFIKNLKRYKKVSDTNFIKDVWVRDLLALQKKLGFKYTTYLIFNYNKDTGYKNSSYNYEIKDFYLARGGMTVKMGELALEKGWELGFHGFNHMSLTLTRPKDYDSTPWPDKESMLKALNRSRREWEKIYTPVMLPFSYVAPHNIIDKTGTEALGEAFPSIQVLSTLYVSSQGEREQEFEFTEDRRFLQIPRMSSGYAMQDTDSYLLFDVLHNFGVISHFIHPDDVFDEHRSFGYHGWDWMKKQFSNQFMTIEKYYPWVRWMTVKDAYSEFLFYNNTGMNVIRDGDKITVLTSDGSSRDFFFRMSLARGRKPGKITGCKLVSFNRKSGDAVFKTSSYRCEIEVR